MEGQKAVRGRKKKSKVNIDALFEETRDVPFESGNAIIVPEHNQPESFASATSGSGHLTTTAAGTTNKKPPPKKRGRKRKKRFSDCESITSVTGGVNKIIIKKPETSKKTKTKILPQPAPPPPPSGGLELLPTLRPSGKTADWDEFLNVGYNLHFIPPVSYFKHAPLGAIWSDLAKKDTVVEIPNPFVRCPRPVNWIATIRHFAGYKALVEFETFGVHPRHAAWMSFCSDVPKYLGYSDTKRILLYPPHVVKDTYPDFLDRAREFVQNKATVSEAHGEYIQRHLKKSQKYPLLTMLEVMDRDCANRMRVATVTGTIGNRIHVTYVIEPRKDDVGYWFDVNSDFVHPIGWSQTVNHEIYGVPCTTPFTPLPTEYFPAYPRDLVLIPSQMLEARHPLRPYLICAASVCTVLNQGYFIAEFCTTANERLFFTFHVTSPFVFPCGFCAKNDIPLIPPHGQAATTFTWRKYMDKRMLYAAPLHLIPTRNAHKFKPGMKMEACGILDPTYLGPVTIKKVRAHLLYLSFDGWPFSRSLPGDSEFWTHAESSEIYPLGYAEMVGHNFQGCVEPNKFNDIEEQFKNIDTNSKAKEVPSSSSSSSSCEDSDCSN